MRGRRRREARPRPSGGKRKAEENSIFGDVIKRPYWINEKRPFDRIKCGESRSKQENTQVSRLDHDLVTFDFQRIAGVLRYPGRAF
jgi:hypothetical protein